MYRVNKLIILEFVNNFLSLFYIAFVLGDIKQLRSQLMTQLIIIQAVQNVQETVVPILKQKYALYMNARSSKSSHPYKILINEDSSYDYLNIEEFLEDDPIVEQNKYECTLDAYDSTYEDYLELYVQFGYVVLFSSVAPWAALCAFINNVLEIRLDAFKVYDNLIVQS